jgi:hypothetical protein
MMADITVFDAATIATSRRSTTRSTTTGVRHVLVNGKRVVADGAITSERPGRPLRGTGLWRRI